MKSQEIQIIRDIKRKVTRAVIFISVRSKITSRIDSALGSIGARAILSRGRTVAASWAEVTYLWIFGCIRNVSRRCAEEDGSVMPMIMAYLEKQRSLARQRDQYRCRICGLPEGDRPHHVHHKVPFRMFTDPIKANELENLVTLCPNCHRLAEINVRIRSAISGLKYSLNIVWLHSLWCATNLIWVLMLIQPLISQTTSR